MTLSTRFDTLLLYDPSHARSTVNVWVAQPTAGEEEALGKLFVISLIDSAEPINQEVIQLLQEETKRQYYHNAAWTVERSLEFTLEQINQRLHHLITEGVGQWVDHAHLLIGALHHQQLVLAPAGVVHGYLLRGSRIHNILTPDQSNTISPLRVFSQIIVGRLDDHDRLLFCTPSLLDFFSLEKLRRIVQEHQPAEAVRIIEGTLLGANPENAFAALVVELTPATEPLAASPLTVGSIIIPRPTTQASMEELISREQATEKLLAPSLWPTIKEMTATSRRAADRFIQTKIFHRPPRRTVPQAMTSTIPSRQPSAGFPVSRWWRSISWRLRMLIPRRAAVIRQPDYGPALRPMNRAGAFDRLVFWVQGLSRRRQALLAAGLALLLIFSISIVRNNSGAPSNTNQNQSVTAITDHLDKAEAALLYGGETTANQELQAAETLINQLPNRRAADKTQRQALADRLNRIIARLAHQTIINDPTVFAAYAADLPTFRPQQLYLLKNQLVAYDPTQGTLATTSNAAAGTPVVVPATVDIGQPLTGTISGPTTVMFVTDRSSFAEVDVGKKTWKPFDASWPVSKPEIQFLSFFQNRFYALDRSHQQIYRFVKGTSSLGLGQAWLQETAALSAARAAVVDGSVYVLQPGGQVELYFRGRRSADFHLTAVRPPLTNPIRLWTDAASTNLYLLDPGHQRLVVFDKQGQLIDQYTSPTWNNLRDVVANEKNKQAYVLNGTTVYLIDLKH